MYGQLTCSICFCWDNLGRRASSNVIPGEEVEVVSLPTGESGQVIFGGLCRKGNFFPVSSCGWLTGSFSLVKEEKSANWIRGVINFPRGGEWVCSSSSNLKDRSHWDVCQWERRKLVFFGMEHGINSYNPDGNLPNSRVNASTGCDGGPAPFELNAWTTISYLVWRVRPARRHDSSLRTGGCCPSVGRGIWSIVL